MKITFLGTGNAFAPKRDWSSILVNESILLDVGPSMLVNLKRLGLNPTRIRHIFISHFHGDHFFGLPFLLLEYYFSSPTEDPLAIIGPPGVEATVRRTMELAYPDVFRQQWPRPITFIEVDEGASYTVDGLAFSAVAVAHAPGWLQAYGYRLYLDDGILAYSGDTSMTPSLLSLIDGARAIILEASSHEVSQVHLGLDALRPLLAQAPAGSTVFVNHLDTPDAGAWQDLPVIVPADLHAYQLSLSPSVALEESHD